MTEIPIDDLAYLIKEAKLNGQPQPIFFLGAGASVSGNIPLAGEIANDILAKYPDSPFIKKLDAKDRSYATLMDCLSPFQRNELLKEYIDEAKINVTHIYLAQLLKHGYVDYILTVNFDNLMLRALALFNEFPSTYDMAILKDLTTTSFNERSVVYLHGQHHGLWLLNTPDEMDKVKATVPRIFDSIKNKRPWIFIGYSGSDPIFEHIKGLGRFDNRLFWVGYRDSTPSKSVQDFLRTPNTNAFHIKGYDSDAFMLKLNETLGLEQPEILEKPFSSLQAMLNEINDINDEEHFKGVRERLEMAKKNVDKSIRQFERQEKVAVDEQELKADQLKKRIIALLISETHRADKIKAIEEEAKEINDASANSLLSGLYSRWGDYLGNLAKTKTGKEADELYHQAFEKYNRAVEINPVLYDAFNNWGVYLCNLAQTKSGKEADELYHQAFEKYARAKEIKADFPEAFYNWGTYLGNLAKTKSGKEADELYHQAFEKYNRAIEIKPDLHKALNNWGSALGNLAKTKSGKEADGFYHQAVEKYKKAIEIKPDFHGAFYNWGNALGDLAQTKSGKEAADLYHQGFEKYKKAIEIKPDLHEAFYNWGNALGNLAKTKPGKEADELYHQAFEKYKRAIEIKPDKHEAFDNWGNTLLHVAKTKTGAEAGELYDQALEKLNKAIEFGGRHYNLACLYALRSMKDEAFHHLDISLAKNEITIELVNEDEDWKEFREDADFKNLLKKHRG